MRTTKTYIEPATMERLMETATAAEMYRAIGYLSQWGLQYPVCNITVADVESPELVATYHRAGESDARPAYVLAAVWNGSAFGFHS